MNSNISDGYEDSVDRLCERQPAKQPNYTEENIPNFMRVTESSKRREELRIQEDRRRSLRSTPTTRRSSLSSPLYDKNNLPRYMRDTESFRQRVSVAPLPAPRVASTRIKEVDVKNKPRYMNETESYRKQVAKEYVKPRVNPKQIKEVDLKNKPSYMNETASYRSRVQPEPSKPRLSPRQIKPVDLHNKPRYMQSTEAWEHRIKPAPKEAPRVPVPAKAIKEVDVANLPHYMKLTETAKKHGAPKDDASVASTASRQSQSRRLEKGQGRGASPGFMNTTQSYMALCKMREEERKRMEEQGAERMRRRKSLAVRCTEWEQKRKNAEYAAIKRKERIQREMQEERRMTMEGARPRFMNDTACSRQLAKKWLFLLQTEEW